MTPLKRKQLNMNLKSRRAAFLKRQTRRNQKYYSSLFHFLYLTFLGLLPKPFVWLFQPPRRVLLVLKHMLRRPLHLVNAR